MTILPWLTEHTPAGSSTRNLLHFLQSVGTDRLQADILFLKHDSSTLRQSSNSVCGFPMMEQVRLCAGWPTESWLGSSMNPIQWWKTV